MTTQSDVPSGGTVVKSGFVIDANSQVSLTTLTCGSILACGFNCRQTNQDALTFTCFPPQGQTACRSGAQVQALVSSQNPGELGESVFVTPPDNSQPQQFTIAPRDAVIWVSRGVPTGSAPFFSPGVNESPNTPGTQPANNPPPIQSQPANSNTAAIANLQAQIATLQQQQAAADAGFAQQFRDNTAETAQWSDFGTASSVQFNADLELFKAGLNDRADALGSSFSAFPFVEVAGNMLLAAEGQAPDEFGHAKDTLQQIVQLEVNSIEAQPEFVNRIDTDLQTLLSNADDMYQLVGYIIQANQAYQTLLSIRQSIRANEQSADASFQQQIAALQSQISALGG